MKFPVDLLADVSHTELERLAHNYMNNLLYSNPDSPEHLTLSDSTQVTIDISSVGFVPLYGSSDKQKILAVFSPSDPMTAVGLYLLDQWWTVDDILKTADPARDGAVEVETVGERIVLYILNRVIYRAKEMSSEELPFLCHGERDNAKILWNNGEAVGFYSVKPSGSFCNSFSTRSYQLPVMDSIFVRKGQRGKGFGLQMLEDFVLSFKEDCLGLRYPLTKSMYKVCEKYLCQYPGDTGLLWEVESIGGPKQRTNIASKIQAMDESAVSKRLSFTEESLVITEITEKDVMMEAITTQIQEAASMECRVEIVEEVTVLSATKEAEVPLTARGRSSGTKQRKMGEKIAEDKSEKVIRIEDIEAETPREEHVSAQQRTELCVSELVQIEGVCSLASEEQGEDVVDTAPEEAATMSDQPATVLPPQDLEETDVTSGPTTEEPQAEAYVSQDLTNTSPDSQITVENVASEIEEECHKEDTAELVVSEEHLEDHKEAKTLDKVGEETEIVVTDEKSEERVSQQEVSLSTCAASENGEAGKTERPVVKAITTVRRATRNSKLEEGVKEETTAQEGGIILRGRTLMNIPTPKRKYTQRSQKVCDELEKEVKEVAEEKDVSTPEVVEELAVTEGEEQEEEVSSIKEDVVNTAAEEAATMSDQSATVLAPQDLEEADVTSGPTSEEPQEEGDAPVSDQSATVLAPQDQEEADATSGPTTEEPQAEDDVSQDLTNTSPDSQITVENVASEIEEECQKEDTAELVVSEEHLEDHKEAETLDKVGEETEIVVTDEKSEERVTQHEASLSTCATSDSGEAGQTERPVVKVKTIQTKPPTRRSTRHSKLEEGVKEETTAQDGGIILRGRTLMNIPTPKRKYTRRSKKVCEELEKEVEEVAEEKDISTPEVVEELAVTEGGEEEEVSSIKEDVVNTAAEEAATMSDQSATVLAPQDLEEADVTSGPTTEEPQEEGDVPVSDQPATVLAPQDLEETNVTSGPTTEEPQEEGDVPVSDQSATVLAPQDLEEADVTSGPTTEEPQEEGDVPVSDQSATVLAPQDLEEADVTSGPTTEEPQEEGDVPVSDQSATVLAPQDLEEADVTSGPTTEEPQEEGDVPQDLTNTSPDSQITVENVASEIEEECQKEDTAELLDVHNEAETLEKVGEETEIVVPDEKSEERVTQHEASLSTCATSDSGDAGKTERTVVKAITTVQSKPPTRRSTRHSKLEEGVKEETTAQDGRIILRGRTLINIPTPKRKYTRRSKKVCEELEKEVKEVAEEKDVSTPEVVEELAVTEGEEEEEEKSSIKEDVVAMEELTEEIQQLKDEHLTNKDETEKQQEPGVDVTVVEGSSTELPDTAETTLTEENEDVKVTDESEKEQNGEEVESSVIQDKQGIPDEIEEPPAGGSADGQAADKQMDEHQQVEQEGTADQTEEEISTEKVTVVEEGTILKAEEAAEEVNTEEMKDVQEEEETEGETEAVSVMETEEEAVGVSGVADDVIQATAAAAEEVIPDKVLSDTVVPAAEEPQKKDIRSEIPKLQKATVILVDIKTTCHHLTVTEAEESLVSGDSVDPEKQKEEEDGGKQENIPEKSADDETVDKEELESDNFEKENGSNQQQQEEDTIGEGITEKEVDEAKTGTDEVEVEMEAVAKDTVTVTVPVEEKQSAVSEICADREVDVPVGDDAEENLPPAEVDEAEEEEAPVETRALRRTTKTSIATPVRKSTRSRKQVDTQEAENSEEEEEPAVTTRTLRHRSIPASDTPKGKSRKSCKEGGGASMEKSIDGNELPVETRTLRRGRKSACGSLKKLPKQEEGPKESAEESAEESAVEEDEEAGLGSAEEPPTEGGEGKAPKEDKIEVENEELAPVDEEKGESEERAMPVTEDEENTAGVTAAADDLVQGETDAPLSKPATDPAVPPPKEEEATPSAEEQQNEEMAPQLSDLRTVTVVLVDLQKPQHDIQEETAASEESPPVQETAAEAEEEQREETTKEEETRNTAQENVPGSPVGTEEEGKEVTIHDTEEGRAEETAKEEEAISINNEEQEPTIPETRTRGSRKQDVEATPKTKLARSRQKRGEVEKEVTSEIQEEEPAVQVRVLRRGRKSIPVTPRYPTKRTRKQLQEEEEEEEEEEESAAVEAREAEEEEEQQQMTDQEKGERLEERDATEPASNIAAEVGKEKEDTVAEEDVIQQDAPEQGQADITETVLDEDAEAPAGQHADEGKTLVVADEAVTTQDTVEGEQAISTPEVVESAAGQSAQETLLTAKDDEEKGASEEEEAPVIPRVLRSGGKTVRATTRGKTTKQQDGEQEEEATGEKSTEEEDEPVVETRVLRKGRKTVAATPRRKSKRARLQCQTEEDEEEETTSPEEIQVEEAKAVLEEAGENEKSSDEKVEIRDGDEAAAQEEENMESGVEIEKVEAVAEETEREKEEAGQESAEEKGEEVEGEGKIVEMEKDKDVEEEEVERSEEGESAVGDAEQMTDASPDEATVLEEEDSKSVEAVDEVGSDMAEIPSAEVEETNSAEEEETTVTEKSAATEVGSDAAVAEEEALVEDAFVAAEEEAPTVTTRAVRGKIKTLSATPSQRSRRQKDQGALETQEQEEETPEDEVHQLNDDSPRRSVRKRPRVDYRETDEEGERDETEAMDEEEGDRVESDVDKDNKEAERSSDTDEEDGEGDEQSMSEEEVEPIVIGKRVLRGRSIPSLIITPKSTSRRHGVKVSNEEKSPRSARKRKSTEVTPARKSKRLSRL